MNAIQESFTDKLFANYEANVKYQAIENAASHNGIFAALERRQSHVDNTPVFSLDLTKDKVTNQKASGRCWMFAALLTLSATNSSLNTNSKTLNCHKPTPSSGTSMRNQTGSWSKSLRLQTKN